MKLSEILSQPFKVKGGGTVNLKGLSKHIVDKEVGNAGNKIYNSFEELIQQEFGISTIENVDEIDLDTHYAYTVRENKDFEVNDTYLIQSEIKSLLVRAKCITSRYDEEFIWVAEFSFTDDDVFNIGYTIIDN